MPNTLLPYVLWNEEAAENIQTDLPIVTGGQNTPYPEGYFCVPLTINAEQATRILSALYSGAMILYPEDYLSIVIPLLQGLNDIGECGDMSCEDAINGFRRANNWIQITRCNNPTWTNTINLGAAVGQGANGEILFDFDGNGLPDQTIYANSYQNIYGDTLPLTDTNDMLCRAAWSMARQYTDAFNSLIGIVGAVDNFLAGAIQMFGDLGVVTALADDTIEFLTQDWVQATVDFLKSNAKTDQTVGLAAELIYCALSEAYPDDYENFWDYIEWGAYAPLMSALSGGKVQWGNFGDIATSIKNTLLGRFTAYLALGYAQTSIYWAQEKVGVYQPTKKMLEKAFATAMFFDARDCLDMPCNFWVHTINFSTEASYFDFKRGSADSEGNYVSAGQNATWISPNHKRQTIEVQFDEIGTGVDYLLTEVTFNMTVPDQTCELTVLNWFGGMPPLYSNYDCVSGDREQIVELPEGHKGLWIIIGSQIIDSPSYPAPFSCQITLTGTGSNPFEV